MARFIETRGSDGDPFGPVSKIIGERRLAATSRPPYREIVRQMTINTHAKQHDIEWLSDIVRRIVDCQRKVVAAAAPHNR